MKAGCGAKGVAGLTIVEVLVAMTMLAVLAAAIVAGFSSIVQLNRTASEDVDYSRVIRTTTEQVRLLWVDPEQWDDALTLEDLSARVNDIAQGLSADCTALVRPPHDEEAVADIGSRLTVRVLEVVCGDPDDPRTLVYNVEFGAP